MDQSIFDLSLWQIATSFVFLFVLLAFLGRRNPKRQREILWASVRMTGQLVAAGFVLSFLFDNMHPMATVGIILVMELFAIHNVFERTRSHLFPRIRRTIGISIALGTLSSISFFLFAVVRIEPWFDPRYAIPLAGMLIGNSMTGITLGVSSLTEGMRSRRQEVLNALMLGATPKRACREILDQAFEASILPTVNAMMGMGIIFLPGMMTGQILSGTDPSIAIKYQIAVMMGILGSVSLSVLLSIHLGYRTFFNEEDQLIERDEPEF